MTELHSPAQLAPIAVVGIGSMYPGSATAEGFWEDIVRARDLMTEVPDSHWLIEEYYDPDPGRPDKTYCRRGAFLSPAEFDPMEFGVPPAILRSTDTSQLLSLIVARDVLDDVAGGRPQKAVRDRTSVILGFSGAQELVSPLAARLQRPIWARAMRENGLDDGAIEAICDRIAERYVPWDESSFPGLLGNVVAGRVANRLDLHGSNLTVDAACASSLAAVHTAVNLLLLGETDLAIAGGADANNDIFVYLCFSKTPALSRTEDCRPFSDGADGTMMGEGIGMVALKRLDDAERDGNRIYAVLRGIGSSSDGRSKSIYAPRSDGQALALKRCYARADYRPETVGLVEAHGTGTRAGDLAEMEGLRAVFGGARGDGRHTIALGSVKSQIGHTKAAAGAAGLLKVVMALHQKVLPPTIKVERPDPELKLEDSPFYLNTVARPWVHGGAHPRRASVSAFGFGGTNYHVTLEEYEAPGTAGMKFRLRTAGSELILLSGETSAALAGRCGEMSLEHADVVASAFTSQREFDPAAPVRLAIVADSASDLAAKLSKAAACLRESETPSLATPDGIYLSSGRAVAGDVALLFPGQGSQYVGMGADLAMSHPCARRIWDAAADTRFDGLTLHEVVFPPPLFGEDDRQGSEDRLSTTEWAQPALALASTAGSALLHALDLRPRWFLGHSFGELAALCAAGSFPAQDLLKLARIRGELMRDAARESPGGMTAVFATSADVASMIDRAGASAVIANYNSDDEGVVSGSHEALERLEKLCAAEGIIARRLPVAAAFHSPAVAAAASRFADALADVDMRPPAAVVLANADASPYPGTPDGIRQRLTDQLAQPVRFADMVREAYACGARVFIETGPGSVLSGLTGRILKDEPHLAVSIDRRSRDGVTSLHHALARLATAGMPLNLAALWESYQPPPVRPRKHPGTTVMLTGTNYGKPQPRARIPARDARHGPGSSARSVAASLPGLAADPTPAPVSDGRPSAPQPFSGPHPVPVPDALSVPDPFPGPAPLRAGSPATPPVADLPGLTSGPGLPHPAEASWAQAYDDIQRRVAETHVAVTRAMADMHTAFLTSMASSFSSPSGMPGGQQPPLVAQLPAATPSEWAATAAGAPLLPPAGAEPHSRPAAAVQAAESPAVPTGTAALPLVPPRLPGVPAEAGTDAAAPLPDLGALLLSLIAQKTGYQQDMLGMHMELEADLGIDSIKRVEILAAMRDAVPTLPDVDPTFMSNVGTLSDIVERLKAATGAAAAPSQEHASSAAPEVDEPAAAAGRSVLRVMPRPPLGLSLAGLRQARRTVVTDDGAGTAEHVVRGLLAAGVAAEAAAEVPADADAVIFLGGLRAVTSTDEAIAVNREAFRLARTVSPRFARDGGVFVTVQDTGGDFGLAGRDPLRAWLAGAAALARTARREWPAAAVKAIDCQRGSRPPGEVAEAIVTELLTGAESPDICLAADGSRRRPELHELRGQDGPLPLAEGDVVVVSGGARGVTAACLEELACACRPHLVLLGRTVLEQEPSCCAEASGEVQITQALIADAREAGRSVTPTGIRAAARSITAMREVRETLQVLTHAGARVSYLTVDVRDAVAVERSLAGIRAQHGPIKGLVHGAGTLADKLIADKTDAEFDAVFDTKVLGLRTLLSATRQDPLTLLCLFSSAVAQQGNPGQCDYAMANEILNHVACAEQERRGAGCVVRSIGWGPWDGGMVTPSLRQHFTSLGVPLLSTQAGRHAFIAETRSADEVVVVAGSGGGDGMTAPWARPADAAFDIWVDGGKYPYLADHAIGGIPVVPVALVAEWFHRALDEVGHGRVPVLRSLSVLSGVRLDHRLRGESLRLSRRFGDGCWQLTLYSAQGQPAYSATADYTPWSPQGTAVAGPSSRPADGEQLYDGFALFHGPAFQALQSLEDDGDLGMSADIIGLTELGWPDEAWRTDPAALDAMLQLGVRWTGRLLEGAALPMGFEALHLASAGPMRGPMRASVRTRQIHHSRAVCDITLAGKDGTPLALLAGVSFVLRPDRVTVPRQPGDPA